MRAEATIERRQLRKTMEDKKIKVVSLHKNESFSSFLFLCQGREEKRNYFNPAIRKKVEAIIRELMSKALYQDSRSEEHTSELQSRGHLVCRLLLEKKKR